MNTHVSDWPLGIMHPKPIHDHTAQQERLAAWLREPEQGAVAVRMLPDGSVAKMIDLLYTRAIVLGCTWDGWTTRFCFEDRDLATKRFAELIGEDDVPIGFVAQRFGRMRS